MQENQKWMMSNQYAGVITTLIESYQMICQFILYCVNCVVNAKSQSIARVLS